jgi:hypothetical protein
VHTSIGQGFFPRPPGLRLAAAKNLTDGELFYIIEHGVRFTGMAGFGSDDGSTSEGSWHLVPFIRHLPDISAPELAEMESLNPAPPEDFRQRIFEEQFLQGADLPPAPATPTHKH